MVGPGVPRYGVFLGMVGQSVARDCVCFSELLWMVCPTLCSSSHLP